MFCHIYFPIDQILLNEQRYRFKGNNINATNAPRNPMGRLTRRMYNFCCVVIMFQLKRKRKLKLPITSFEFQWRILQGSVDKRIIHLGILNQSDGHHLVAAIL